MPPKPKFTREDVAQAALAIIDHGVSETANRFNGSHP